MQAGRFKLSFVTEFLGRLVEQPATKHARHLGPCLVWTGAVDRDGYGNVSYEGVTYKAHAVGFEVWHGRAPQGEVLRHLCGRALCCAGQHLVEGTHRENLSDAIRHGTHVGPPHPCGSRHPEAKLDDDDIDAIKVRLAAGDSQQEIADDFGVSQPLISAVLHGKARTCGRKR